MPLLRCASLVAWTSAMLARTGAPEETARHVVQRLVDADLTGHAADGVVRLPQYIGASETGQLDPTAIPRVLRAAPAGIVISGGNGFGEMTLSAAADAAEAAARSQGVAAVAVRDSHGVGRLRPFVEELAAADMAAVLMANGDTTAPAVIPWGGTLPQLGRNPVALGVPRGRGRTLVLELCVASDAQQGDALDGLLPFGGLAAHKGYGLGLIIEILAGAMTAAGCAGDGRRRGSGAVLLTVAIGHFTAPQVFKEEVERLLEFVQTAVPVAARQPLWAGEQDEEKRDHGRAEGVPVDRVTVDTLQECARHLGLSDGNWD